MAGLIFAASPAGMRELGSGRDRLLAITEHLASEPAGASDSETADPVMRH